MTSPTWSPVVRTECHTPREAGVVTPMSLVQLLPRVSPLTEKVVPEPMYSAKSTSRPPGGQYFVMLRVIAPPVPDSQFPTNCGTMDLPPSRDDALLNEQRCLFCRDRKSTR